MSWLDQLQLEGKGSFRGIEFFVNSAESIVGRRTSLREFPGSDHVEVEDLGRLTRRFTLVAYVLGDDYMTPRDELRDAFEKAGPGPLVHPYWGEVIVSIDGPVRIRETTDEGGMARFTLNVIRVTEDIVRVVVPDTAAKIEAAADLSITALAEDFVEDWSVTGVIENVRTEAAALVSGVNGVASVLNTVNGHANAAMNAVDKAGDAISALSDAAATLILTPQTLVDRIQASVVDVIATIDTISDALGTYFGDDETAGSVAGTPENSPTASTPASGDQRAETLMVAFRDMTDYGGGFATVDETTPQREAQADNQAAMLALFRGVSVVETARAVANVPFVSNDLATSVRDELSDILDALADIANDITYAALVDLRSVVVRHLTDVSNDLPRIITYTPMVSLPALVIAHRLYGDSTRDVDIVERNNVRNPCRVPGMVELEVLSSD